MQAHYFMVMQGEVRVLSKFLAEFNTDLTL